MRIQRYFIHKKIKAILHQQSINGNSTQHASIAKINKVAIIVDEFSLFNNHHFKQLQKSMSLDDTDFEVLTIKHKKSNYNEFKGNVLFSNDVNISGNIASKEVNSFLNTTYDMVLDCIAPYDPLKCLIVASTKAPIKIGFSGNPPELYNIVIEVKHEKIEVFLSEVLKYLKILKVI